MNIQLNDFEGPLDLLVYLVKTHKMDIFDIDVHKITEQYFIFIKDLKNLDLEKAGDFILMASSLIQLKAKVLIQEELKEEEVEDPRIGLSQKLIEYMKVKKYSIYLNQQDRAYRDFSPRPLNLDLYGKPEEFHSVEQNGLFLLSICYRKMSKQVKKYVHKIRMDLVDVSEKIDSLRNILKVGSRLSFSNLLKKKNKNEVLLNFLSLLQLSQKGFVSLFQAESFSEIYVETLKEIRDEKWEGFRYQDQKGFN